VRPEFAMIFVEADSRGPMEAALRACRRHFRAAAVFSALLNLLFIAPMLYMLQVYDRVVPTQSGLTLTFLTVVLLFALATLSLLDFIRSRLLIRASVRLDRLLSRAIIDASLARSADGGHKGSKQAVREFDKLRQALSGPGVIAAFDAPWTPIYVLVSFVIHPYLGVLALVGALTLLFLAWRNEVGTRARLQQANEAAGKAYVSHDFTASAADVVRALGMRRALVARHAAERETMTTLQTEASFASGGWSALSKFLRLVLQSAALGMGALLAIANEISPGAIFAAMFLVGRALAPIDQVIGAWRGIVDARGAYRTLSELFAQTEVDVSQTQLPPPGGQLEVEKLTVAAPGRDRPILSAVSFAVRAGDVVGILGPSGAGKSTLVRTIVGAASFEEGSIRFDGAEQRDWDPERLAWHVGYMPQEAALFAGTIKENIVRFCSAPRSDHASIDEQAVEAARLAGAHDLILRLPGGYDYRLGLGGRGLSAGQAQRVALARAVFGNPAYLILDEPNAHLDPEGDQQLVRSIAELKKRGTTILIVAHRMSVLPVIDRLLVIRDGRIELYGPREEVMRRISPATAPRAVPPAAASA
jgi:ATP-binding cassette subfamily C protein